MSPKTWRVSRESRNRWSDVLCKAEEINDGRNIAEISTNWRGKQQRVPLRMPSCQVMSRAHKRCGILKVPMLLLIEYLTSALQILCDLA